MPAVGPHPLVRVGSLRRLRCALAPNPGRRSRAIMGRKVWRHVGLTELRSSILRPRGGRPRGRCPTRPGLQPPPARELADQHGPEHAALRVAAATRRHGAPASADRFELAMAILAGLRAQPVEAAPYRRPGVALRPRPAARGDPAPARARAAIGQRRVLAGGSAPPAAQRRGPAGPQGRGRLVTPAWPACAWRPAATTPPRPACPAAASRRRPRRAQGRRAGKLPPSVRCCRS